MSISLSSARDKIKKGVLKYKDFSGEELYCVAGVPLLAALFIYERRDLVLPNIVSQVMTGFSTAAQNVNLRKTLERDTQVPKTITQSSRVAPKAALAEGVIMKKSLLSF